jgi:phosphoglycerate dehydrogenase-like enzyme
MSRPQGSEPAGRWPWRGRPFPHKFSGNIREYPMQRPKVLLWRPMYYPGGHKMLEERGIDVVVVDSSDPGEIKQALHGARALWVRTPERLTADILDAGKDLVLVSTSGFGTDNIDIGAATERGILVVNHRGFGRVPVSEHAILMILAAAKRLVWGDQATRTGSAWATRSGLELFELQGKTVGIVGVGFIGSEIARKLALGFRCRVVGYDPYVDPRLAHLAGIEMMPRLRDLLRISEILVLVPELTDETRNMIGADELSALPQGAIVVNVGRGQVLDLAALAGALERKHIRAAALDVVYPEPLPDGHPLLRNPDVTFSPHIAGGTVEATIGLAKSAVEQIAAGLAGDFPSSPVNRTAWEGPRSRRPN